MIGGRIRAIRLQKKQTQKQVAEGICSKSMLSLIESNQTMPSIELLSKLCKRLGVSIRDLYDDASQDEEFARRISYIDDLFLYQEYTRMVKEVKQLLRNKQIVDDPKKVAMCTSMLGRAFFQLQEFKSALGYYEQSLHIAQAQHLVEEQTVAHNGIAGVYYQLQDHQKSLEHWKSAYELMELVQVDPRIQIKVLYNISNLYSELEDMDKTLQYAHDGLYLCKKTGIYECGGHLATMIGLVMLGSGNWDSAREYLTKALQLYEFLGDTDSVIGTYLNLAKVAYSAQYISDGRMLLTHALGLIKSRKTTAFDTECDNLIRLFSQDETDSSIKM